MQCFQFDCGALKPVDIYAGLSEQSYFIWLDSADDGHKNAHYSYMVWDPIACIEHKDGTTTINHHNSQYILNGDVFEHLQNFMAGFAYNHGEDAVLPPFHGGLVGLCSYDLGRQIETLPTSSVDNQQIQDLACGFYTKIYAYDHKNNTARFVINCEDAKEADAQYKLFQSLISGTEEKQYQHINVDFKPHCARTDFEAHIQTTKDYILAGDIFQANITQTFSADLPEGFCLRSHYLNLRQRNPAPFAALMCWDNFTLASASPERFIQMNRGGCIETRPIKGTSPRYVSDAVRDQRSRESLEGSTKDRAENIMIVDLLRNDLSKVCEAQSVRVDGLCVLESFARVHHLVSTVRGQLSQDKDAIDVIEASFPGGSITGAPKIRAMEIIDELERERRGPYCGSLIWIGRDGAMDSNILIRTLIYKDNQVRFSVGGGITALSDPAAEYQESLDKARGLLDSFDDINEVRKAS